MIVKMKSDASRPEIDYVVRRAVSLGLRVHESIDNGRVLLSLLGPLGSLSPSAFAEIRGVDTVLPTTSSFRLASRDYRDERTTVSVGDVALGLLRLTHARRLRDRLGGLRQLVGGLLRAKKSK